MQDASLTSNFLAFDFCQLLEQIDLFVRQISGVRNIESDPGVMVAMPSAIEPLYSLAWEAKLFAVLGTTGNLEGCHTLQGLDLHLGTHDGLSIGDVDFTSNVRPLSFKAGMGLDKNIDVKVSSPATAPSVFSFTG
jgi:hypothetical protein